MSGSPHSKYKYTLYGYFRSSCSGRVRIAAHLKGIPLEHRSVDVYNGGQAKPEYSSLNPSESVPTLVVSDAATGEEVTRIGQSVAILEFFEEVEGGVKLLPGPDDPVARARVRVLVNIIADDVQPVTNFQVLTFIKRHDIKVEEWQDTFMSKGFRAYEELIKLHGGRYSFGDELTLADCVLAPAVDGALRFGVDVQRKFPRIWKVWETIKQLDAFKQGRWNNQHDTPADLKHYEYP